MRDAVTLPEQFQILRRANQMIYADPNVISVLQAADRLGISKDLAYDLARRGQLPGAIHLGRRWRVSLVKLNQFVHGTEDSLAEETG
jgi:excisionase family DNA binding protein